MKLSANALLDSLEKKVLEIIDKAQDFSIFLSEDQMYWFPDDNEWSIADCLEHLNLYGDRYLPIFEEGIKKEKGKPIKGSSIFKSGWFGEYYIESVKFNPEDELNKTETLEEFDPKLKEIRRGVLNVFIDQQRRLIEILHKSSLVDLSKIKLYGPNNSWFKINLGDWLRWFVAHSERHIHQSDKIYKVLREF